MGAEQLPPGDSPAAPKPPSNSLDTMLTVIMMMAQSPVMLLVDARHPYVRVPEAHRGNPALPILIGWNRMMSELNQVPDLEVTPRGVYGQIFTGHATAIPWAAVWRAKNSHRSLVWGERAPEELQTVQTVRAAPGQISVQETEVEPESEEPRVERSLRSIPMPEDEERGIPTAPCGSVRVVPECGDCGNCGGCRWDLP